MPRGVLESSTRTSRIEQWLRGHKALDKATTLVLRMDDDDDGQSILSTWEHDESWSCERVAAEADSVLQNVSDELGARIKARLRWMTPAGSVWTSLPVYADPAQGAAPLDGSNKSQATQAQKHLEAVMLLQVQERVQLRQEFQDLQSFSRSIMELATKRGSEVEEELARLRDENAELKSAMMIAQQAADLATTQAEEAATTVADLKKDKDEDSNVVNMLGKALLANNEKPKKPPPSSAAQ